MSAPRIGDALYLDKGKRHPVTVIAVMGTSAFYVQGHVSIGSTHKGNLFDPDDRRPYMV